MSLIEKNIECEQWREYLIVAGMNGDDILCVPYRIDNPKKLYYRDGGSTHRVLDSEGVVHCVPSVGVAGTTLTWKNRLGYEPVQF
jgi:hypothetical protein